MIITLDATKQQENSLTPRNEFKSTILDNETVVNIKFRLKAELPAKEVTLFQIMIMDDNNLNIPCIRLSFLDNNSLYITYKDENYINHYTKVSKYLLESYIAFKFEVRKDYIEVAKVDLKTREIIKFWRFEKKFDKYEYKCGLYSQTDEGLYTLDLIDFTMQTLS